MRETVIKLVAGVAATAVAGLLVLVVIEEVIPILLVVGASEFLAAIGVIGLFVLVGIGAWLWTRVFQWVSALLERRW